MVPGRAVCSTSTIWSVWRNWPDGIYSLNLEYHHRDDCERLTDACSLCVHSRFDHLRLDLVEAGEHA